MASAATRASVRPSGWVVGVVVLFVLFVLVSAAADAANIVIVEVVFFVVTLILDEHANRERKLTAQLLC